MSAGNTITVTRKELTLTHAKCYLSYEIHASMVCVRDAKYDDLVQSVKT